MRKSAKERKTKFSTAIRFEEADLTLVLACKEEGETDWTYYSREELMELNEALEPLEDEETGTETPESPGPFSQRTSKNNGKGAKNGKNKNGSGRANNIPPRASSGRKH